MDTAQGVATCKYINQREVEITFSSTVQEKQSILEEKDEERERKKKKKRATKLCETRFKFEL